MAKQKLNVVLTVEESEEMKQFCIKNNIGWHRTEYYDKRLFYVWVDDNEKKMIDKLLQEMERKEVGYLYDIDPEKSDKEMAGLLMDTTINVHHAFEDLVRAYDNGSNELRKGINITLNALIWKDMEELKEYMLKVARKDEV